MQSRLPDVNTAFNTHRKRAIIAMEQKDWTEVAGALNAINGALDPEYRVIISDIEYQKLTKMDKIVHCNKCLSQFDYTDIRVLTVPTSPLGKFVTQTKTEQIWICSKCKHEQLVKDSKIEQTVLKEPYFLGVVPKPPVRRDGILSRLRYDREFERWAWTMLDELEAKMAEYRDDNWDRGESNEMSTMVDTSWEENDASST